ncbi:hypothetical protein [Endozoicomonas arenosclerae]|uniref:hypothetical protein n=1 Tax=Endozoicomonas arenosclerae TaxID=1633495 RepID=UPI0007835DBB|nr:hypothetical protein [Endozoicomonas arenosclerae]
MKSAFIASVLTLSVLVGTIAPTVPLEASDNSYIENRYLTDKDVIRAQRLRMALYLPCHQVIKREDAASIITLNIGMQDEELYRELWETEGAMQEHVNKLVDMCRVFPMETFFDLEMYTPE